jgi:hypothetical protein
MGNRSKGKDSGNDFFSLPFCSQAAALVNFNPFSEELEEFDAKDAN